jgi:hypothetical protein
MVNVSNVVAPDIKLKIVLKDLVLDQEIEEEEIDLEEVEEMKDLTEEDNLAQAVDLTVPDQVQEITENKRKFPKEDPAADPIVQPVEIRQDKRTELILDLRVEEDMKDQLATEANKIERLNKNSIFNSIRFK